MNITNHFTKDELECPCCGECHMNMDFMNKLEEARIRACIPFTINSGFRCEKHNAEVGGKITSSHMKGMAVDISCTSDKDRYTIVEALRASRLARIGIAKTFIHTDDDNAKNAKRLWIY